MSNTTNENEVISTEAEVVTEAPRRKRGRPRVLTDEQRIENRKAAAKKYQEARRTRQAETVEQIVALLSEVNVSRLNKEGKEALAAAREKVQTLQPV